MGQNLVIYVSHCYISSNISEGAMITTNGMFILDDIEGKVTYNGIPGGGGTYAVLGAAICTPSAHVRSKVLWIVDGGHDFPDSIRQTFDQWGVTTKYRIDSNRETTRGLNYYPNLEAEGKDRDLRLFKFLTPKIQINVEDWVGTFGEDKVREDINCFHLVCSAERCLAIINDLKVIKSNPNMGYTIVWEPLPSLCDNDHIEDFKKVFQSEIPIIFSPNAEEASRLLTNNSEEPSTLEQCTELLNSIYQLADGNQVIIRCGKLGSVTRSPIDGKLLHYPAYHSKTPDKVIDPTGGGNTYLGGFAQIYETTKDYHIANICANVAASFAIEQVGIPEYKKNENTWNGTTFVDRLKSYLQGNDYKATIEEIIRKIEK